MMQDQEENQILTITEIATPVFTIRFLSEPDFAELIIRDSVFYDEVHARETKALLEKQRPGVKYNLLVSSEAFFMVSRKVRRLGASREFSSHITAVGCYTTNASLTLLADLYNKIDKPAVPTRVFSTREAAYEWLLSQKTSGISSNTSQMPVCERPACLPEQADKGSAGRDSADRAEP